MCFVKKTLRTLWLNKKENHEEHKERTKSAKQVVFNLTLPLRDVPLLSQGEGRFGNAKTG